MEHEKNAYQQDSIMKKRNNAIDEPEKTWKVSGEINMDRKLLKSAQIRSLFDPEPVRPDHFGREIINLFPQICQIFLKSVIYFQAFLSYNSRRHQKYLKSDGVKNQVFHLAVLTAS